jgi:predicted dehydrogenase
MNPPQNPLDLSRRHFIRSSSAAAGIMAFPSLLHAENKTDRIKIGLIGCGGRGSGAANNALTVDPNVQLVAIADVFPERLENALNGLSSKFASSPGRVDVPKERQFTGLDAYKQLLATDIDCVLLATPPGFRPLHFTAAIEAGKHVFCEKPMATDASGVRAVLEATRKAKEKKLSVVAGFCWRYDGHRRAMFEKIHSGDLGEVRGLYHTYLTGPVKPMPAPDSRKEGVSDLEWQLRNWMNFVWLSGDGLVEQACHSVDKMMWAMKDVPPAKCTAVGGRINANPGGNIFDHIEVNYEWSNGVRGVMAQRQVGGCFNDNNDYVSCEKGLASTKGGVHVSGGVSWKSEGKFLNMYEQEHKELYDSIRSGKAHNDGEWMCQSTLAAIMGRMAAYTGQEVSWEHMLKSQENIFPQALDWKAELAVAPMAVPGRTKLV